MNIINSRNTATSAIALQVLAISGLDARFANIVDQFCATYVADSGWTWGDAMETALDAGSTIDFAATPLGRFLASDVRGTTGWRWDTAILESLENGTRVDFNELPFGRYHGAPVLHAVIANRQALVDDVCDQDWGLEMAIELRAERAGRRYH